MATNTGTAFSNIGSGAATGAAIGGPWGALVGGAAGGLASIWGDDPAEQARQAQQAYANQVNAATNTYTDQQNQILGQYGGLYSAGGVKSSLDAYTGALNAANPSQYAIDPSAFQSTYTNPTSTWSTYLDPSIEYQQASARKNVEESAAGQGGLYSAAAANEIARNVADIASTGYNDAYNKARQATMDQNAIAGENFSRNIAGGNYNLNLAQTGIQNLGTSYGVQQGLMDTEMSGRSDLNKTKLNTATGLASSNLSGTLGTLGGPSTWDSLIGAANSANDAGVFNSNFWGF